MRVFIDSKKCRLSGECMKVCPEKAISVKNGTAVIDDEKCDLDGICIPACPEGAIRYIEKGSGKAIKKEKRIMEKKYVCSTCGASAFNKGHLCTPLTSDKAYSCEYCGNVVGDPRHVCKPKLEKLSYVCGGCGRVAAKKSEVCQPKKI
ncbi:MAG: hypothetical protein A2Y00_00190 [Omnitrophica WOR_2 bacterium GWF2_43_52]|nr:MAG: hypothetical protein A2062_02045 [Omnitrophica WOR_2 bacterium GWA2_44_7]OGX20693.1 MAG: hypothetical protein A2Y00_00190 [Omnitrophica WOR_2 bacterium GWF2_43_52]HAH21305.1 hypothetical protein [Candidatus Omnitrophota bacterium]HBG64278.1 hypothetical protein [Candidatus Omnitrophota bacterium]